MGPCRSVFWNPGNPSIEDAKPGNSLKTALKVLGEVSKGSHEGSDITLERVCQEVTRKCPTLPLYSKAAGGPILGVSGHRRGLAGSTLLESCAG